MGSMGYEGVQEIKDKFMPPTQLTATHQGPNANQPRKASTPCTCSAKQIKQQNLGYPSASKYNHYMGKCTIDISTSHWPMAQCEYSHRIIGIQHWSL